MLEIWTWDKIEDCLHETVKDRMLMLLIIAGGRFEWRRVGRDAFKGYAINDQLLDGMFDYWKDYAGSQRAATRVDALMPYEAVKPYVARKC